MKLNWLNIHCSFSAKEIAKQNAKLIWKTLWLTTRFRIDITYFYCEFVGGVGRKAYLMPMPKTMYTAPNHVTCIMQFRGWTKSEFGSFFSWRRHTAKRLRFHIRKKAHKRTQNERQFILVSFARVRARIAQLNSGKRNGDSESFCLLHSCEEIKCVRTYE